MKVISKNPDYYDYIFANLETSVDDKTVFYKRNELTIRSFVDDKIQGSNRYKTFVSNKIKDDEVEVIIKKHNEFLKILKEFLNKENIKIMLDIYLNYMFSDNVIASSKDKKNITYVNTTILFVAGKTTMRFNIYEREILNKNGYRERLIHEDLSYQEFKEIALKNINKYDFNYKFGNYENIETLDCSELLIKMNCPIVALELKISEKIVKFDPVLKEYNYENIEDPFAIHQRIEQFISQQLTVKDKIAEVPDTLKIVNHGFDIKKSFRHR